MTHLSTEKDKTLNVEPDEYVYVHCSSDACHTFQTSHDKGLFIAVLHHPFLSASQSVPGNRAREMLKLRSRVYV